MRKSSGPESVRQHLHRFAAAATLVVGLLGLAWPAEAEIVYTPADIKIKEDMKYNLDLNHDGGTDFIISTKHSTQMCHFGSGTYSTVDEAPVSGNGADGSNPTRLEEGDPIGPLLTFYGSTGTIALLGECPINGFQWSGNWIGEASPPCPPNGCGLRFLSGYLGLMFQIDGETHYGWALLSVSSVPYGRPLAVTLKGYAYETTPGMPINAGQTE